MPCLADQGRPFKKFLFFFAEEFQMSTLRFMSVTYVALTGSPGFFADLNCALLVQGKENETGKLQSLLEFAHILRISCATLYNHLWYHT